MSRFGIGLLSCALLNAADLHGKDLPSGIFYDGFGYESASALFEVNQWSGRPEPFRGWYREDWLDQPQDPNVSYDIVESEATASSLRITLKSGYDTVRDFPGIVSGFLVNEKGKGTYAARMQFSAIPLTPKINQNFWIIEPRSMTFVNTVDHTPLLDRGSCDGDSAPENCDNYFLSDSSQILAWHAEADFEYTNFSGPGLPKPLPASMLVTSYNPLDSPHGLLCQNGNANACSLEDAVPDQWVTLVMVVESESVSFSMRAEDGRWFGPGVSGHALNLSSDFITPSEMSVVFGNYVRESQGGWSLENDLSLDVDWFYYNESTEFAATALPDGTVVHDHAAIVDQVAAFDAGQAARINTVSASKLEIVDVEQTALGSSEDHSVAISPQRSVVRIDEKAEWTVASSRGGRFDLAWRHRIRHEGQWTDWIYESDPTISLEELRLIHSEFPNFDWIELDAVGWNWDYLNRGEAHATLMISVVPESTSADFNGDGTVDGDDFLTWQSNFGTVSGAGIYDGDADGDQDVDGEDYLIWQAQFGTVGAVAVPEAAGWIVLFTFVLALTPYRGWRTSNPLKQFPIGETRR